MLALLEKVVSATEAALGWDHLKELLADVVRKVLGHAEDIERIGKAAEEKAATLERAWSETAAEIAAAASSVATEVRELATRVKLLESGDADTILVPAKLTLDAKPAEPGDECPEHPKAPQTPNGCTAEGCTFAPAPHDPSAP
jgi:hypothetical protein